MKSQHQMCYEASHYATVGCVCGKIKEFELERKRMIERKQCVLEIEELIDKYMNITFQFGF